MRRLSYILVCLGFAACDSSQPDAFIAPPAIDAGPTPDAKPVVPDGGAPDSGVSPQVARGSYIVNAVAACSDCHTPTDPQTHAPIAAKFLSGADCFIDVVPGTAGVGCLSSANLTNDATGLKSFTDAEVKAMFTTGKRPDNSVLVSVMPYFAYHAMTDDDANAVVAYLRTVPAVAHTQAAQEPPFTDPTAVDLVKDADIPAAAGTAAGTTIEAATRGRYLATIVCAECHTQNSGGSVPRDWSKAFAGGQDFQLGAPFPAHIFSRNLTQDVTGIKGWTVADVKKVLAMGKDNANQNLCPPMPFGPMGAFANLTDGDATDIANYIINLAAVANDVGAKCVLP